MLQKHSTTQDRFRWRKRIHKPKFSAQDHLSNADSMGLLKGIIEGSNDLIAALDRHFKFIVFNRAYQEEFEKIFGKKICLGMSLMDALAHLPDEQAKAQEIWGRALRGEKFTVIEEFGDELRSRNCYEIRYSSIHNEQGKFIGAAHIVRDITKYRKTENEHKLQEEKISHLNQQLEQRVQDQTLQLELANFYLQNEIFEKKQIEATLKEKEEHYQLLSKAVPTILFTNLPDGRNDYVSQPFYNYTGMTVGSAVDYGWTNALHPEDIEPATTRWLESVKQGKPFEIEYRFRRSDGQYRWFLGRSLPIRDRDGNITKWFGVCIDIHDRKTAEAALRESEARYAKLADNVPGVIYQYCQFADGHDVFPYISPGCYELYEINSDEIQQNAHLFWECVHPEDLEGLRRSIPRQAQTGTQWQHEWRMITRSTQQIKWLRGIARAERYSDGSVVWDGLLLDISDRKFAEQEREELLKREKAAREAAEAANHVKDQFLAILSHELRTPLNPILGWSRLLQTRRFDEVQTLKALATIERNAELQIQLVDDLLDISRVQQGTLCLNVRPVNLVHIFNRVLESVHLDAQAKSIQLDTNVIDSTVMVLGDPKRLQQVLWNLLSNAIKFTPHHGQIEVCLATLENSSLAQITVRDTGIGIHSDVLPYLFESFYQAENVFTRQFNGLGLGLAISRHLVEMHGGMIEAESAGEGQGATFTIRLPLLESSHLSNQGALLHE